MDNKYRTSIIKKSGEIVSKNESYNEVETFILENMGNIKKCRTCEKGKNNIVQELCLENS
jgi:deoxyhypusine synthase